MKDSLAREGGNYVEEADFIQLDSTCDHYPTMMGYQQRRFGRGEITSTLTFS
jgi:hypothetical protein